MTLPTAQVRRDRTWDGQRFVHNVAAGATWLPFRLEGYEARDTTIAENTQGVAGVQVVRRGAGDPSWAVHHADILFGFVMKGSLTLEGEGKEPFDLSEGDAFVIPPGMRTRWAEPSEDLEVLEVTLPGRFETRAP